MPRGLNRTDLNSTGISYRKGTPILLPKTFGTPITLPLVGNVAPFDEGNPVTWPPLSTHFGNIIGADPSPYVPSILTATFTGTQILELRNHPVLLIPAPGKGLVIELLYAAWQITFDGVPFTNTPVGELYQSHPVLIYGIAPLVPPNLLDAGLTCSLLLVEGNLTDGWFFAPSAPSTPWPSALTVNQPISLGEEGVWTTLSGGTGSVLNLLVLYRIVEAQ